ncbi:BRCT domain-containing protein [Celeribacter marinus]|uniref:BRCT domain-containing protein n=1 Tax=Celeribacter marinus TaxID=1397108 RepID=UPI00317C842A
MNDFEVGGPLLGRIHRKQNEKKYFCYFTGFLQGIVASGYIEEAEIAPLLDQCKEFVENIGDEDAREILEDFSADILEADSLFDAVEYRGKEIDAACARSSLNRFLGFSAGIACDDRITLREAQEVVSFAHEVPSVLEDIGVRAVVSCCLDAIDDGEISPSESAEICHAITRIVGDCYSDTGLNSLGSVPVFDDVKIDQIEEDARFVLTGNFSVSPRRVIEDAIMAHGGVVSSSPSKKTDYVVVASEASRDWIQTHKGTKIVKAIALRDGYGRPDFVSEFQILKILGL